MPKLSSERLAARRRGIVRAAARCLERNGLDGTGMREVFRAANLSPGAVYRYFASKDELLAAVAAAVPSVVEAALLATEDGEEPGDRLRRLLAACAGGLPSARLQSELETAALRSSRVAAALAARRRRALGALARALGQPVGPEASGLTELVVAQCEGLARRKLQEPAADLGAQVGVAQRLLAAALGSDGHAEGVA